MAEHFQCAPDANVGRTQRNSRFRPLQITAMAAAVLLLAACNKEQGGANDASAPAAMNETPQIVRIGSANPLTGPFAHWGRDADNGVQLAVEQANAQNMSIGGRKVRFEVLSEDDQADPKVATQIAQRFIDAKVAAVVGHLTSGAAIPASRLYHDAGIAMVAGSVTSPKFTTQGYNNTFRLIANDAQQGKALAEFVVKQLKFTRIAVIDDRTTYGQGLADDFIESLGAAGVKVLKREYTSNSATDFMAILTTLKGVKPELVFFGGMDAQGGPLASQMRKLGLTAALMGADGINTPEFIKLAGKGGEGSYASAAGMEKALMPGYAAFSDSFNTRFKSEIQAYAPYTYDATRVIIDAMRRADSTDPAKLLPEIGKTQFNGVTGSISFSATGDLNNGTVTLYKLQQGKWQAVKPAT